MKRLSLMLLYAAVTSIVATLPAMGGDRSAGDKAKSGYAVCACEACKLMQADVATLCSKLASGALPAEFCEGMDCSALAALKAQPVHFYAQAFQGRPSDVGAALAETARLFAAKDATVEQRQRLLDFTCFFPKIANEKITADMWRVSKASFRTDHLTALANHGPKELAVELKQRASKDVLAAAHLALQGDGSGKALLVQTAKRADVSKGTVRESALAALGLAALGDAQALPTLLVKAREGVIAALDAGKLDLARALAVEVHYFDQLGKKGASADLGWSAEQIAGLAAKLSTKLATSDDVFHFVEKAAG